jgi:hypothetical protein
VTVRGSGVKLTGLRPASGSASFLFFLLIANCYLLIAKTQQSRLWTLNGGRLRLPFKILLLAR